MITDIDTDMDWRYAYGAHWIMTAFQVGMLALQAIGIGVGAATAPDTPTASKAQDESARASAELAREQAAQIRRRSDALTNIRMTREAQQRVTGATTALRMLDHARVGRSITEEATNVRRRLLGGTEQ